MSTAKFLNANMLRFGLPEFTPAVNLIGMVCIGSLRGARAPHPKARGSSVLRFPRIRSRSELRSGFAACRCCVHARPSNHSPADLVRRLRSHSSMRRTCCPTRRTGRTPCRPRSRIRFRRAKAGCWHKEPALVGQRKVHAWGSSRHAAPLWWSELWYACRRAPY